MVTASVRLDLSHEAEYASAHDRRILADLDHLPDGARVIVDVGSRRWVTHGAADWLSRHADRLNIEVQGTPDADIRAWLDAARGGPGWDAA